VKLLWLTWIDPAPERDGQRIYSGRLIAAVGEAGARIDVVCAASADSRRRPGQIEGGVRWWPIAAPPRSRAASLASTLPHVAHRSNAATMRRRLASLARSEAWDAVVLDGLSSGWALPLVDRVARWRGPRRVVYVSHNHEETTRAGLARNFQGSPWMRAALAHDAAKARRLERRMVDSADLVTAITAEDAARFAARRPDTPVLVLSPGYGGHRVADRSITAETPRRAVIAGSFDWLAKRMNLVEFLAAADARFADAGVELQVVGNADAEFLDGLRRGVRATRLIGPVPAMEPYLAAARLAIVPERTGGGFKLKVLEYVFNRVPAAVISGSIAGMPLESPDTVLAFDSHGRLADGVLEVIDDLPRLNRMQSRAYEACAGRFDWRTRGERFLAGASSA
jgi:glycosyltransferase involved in cell wall biosynthesis